MTEKPEPEALGRALKALRGGGVVAFPTETFYGLAADATSPAAVERLHALKGRPAGKPIACIVGDRSQVALLCDRWPASAERLAARFWPGPLTLVVPAREGLPAPLLSRDAEGAFVGLRLSSHPWARALALGLGLPITATSANLSGGPEASRFEALAPSLLEKIDFALDGGPTPGGRGSSLVRCGAGLTCLREGAIPYAEILAGL